MTLCHWQLTQRRNFSSLALVLIAGYVVVEDWRQSQAENVEFVVDWSVIVHVCLGVICLSSLSIPPLTLNIHAFILSLSSRFTNTTVCHIQFEFNAQLHINLCTCNRIFISLVYISCGAKVSTCCRLFGVVETVHEKLWDRLTLKLVQIWLIVGGCCKIREKHIRRFCKIRGKFTSFIL
jgi:hypothetical protein